MENDENRTFTYLSWKENEEMSSSGVFDIQLHSHKHMPIFGKRGEFSSTGVIVPLETGEKFKNFHENLSMV